MNKESCHFLGHPRLKSGDFISQSWKHRLTCLNINHRFINNIDSHSQSQHHKYGHRQSVYLDVLKLPPQPWEREGRKTYQDKWTKPKQLRSETLLPFSSEWFPKYLVSRKHTSLLYIFSEGKMFLEPKVIKAPNKEKQKDHFYWALRK